jgi:outer membrane protein OmpA-like peptidoglycan-associated protein
MILFTLPVTLKAGLPKGTEKKMNRATELYVNGNYKEALAVFLQVYKTDTSNSNLCYKIGACYLNTGANPKLAIPFLERATNLTALNVNEENQKERHAPFKAYRLLGDAYHLNSDFDRAITVYKKYRQLVIGNRINSVNAKEITRKIEMCLTGKELRANPVEVKIANMGAAINSPYADYSPRLTADQSTMIFTSRRPENTGGKTYDGGLYFEDIYVSKKKGNEWITSNIGAPINTVGNEAAIALSADGQEMLIYKDDFGNGNIYSSHLDGANWTIPVKLNSNINSEFWEPCAVISADGNTMYFVSDRPGGHGGTDIYKSTKLPGGDWGRPSNLGPTINTPYDEYTPFIHPDGVTLYFSSKGHKTMGGYDVFYSRTLPSNNKVWLEPTNVGYPINSTGDDVFYAVSPDKQKAYYTSNRENGFGEKDNYTVSFPDRTESAPLSLLKGVVVDSSQAPKSAVITITDNKTNKVEGVYKTNSKTGEYMFVLTPGNYNISYEADGLLFYSDNKNVGSENNYNENKKDVSLTGLKTGSKVVLNNIFFDFDQSELKPFSKPELDKLYTFMKKNPNVVIEIAGYADSKGSDEYNRQLSLARAQSVIDYLHEKGIEKHRMVAKGKGEVSSLNTKSASTAVATERTTDRRVEMRILDKK